MTDFTVAELAEVSENEDVLKDNKDTNRRGGKKCSQLFQVWNKLLYHLVTRLEMVTDLIQDVRTRLIQTVHTKLLRICCHQLVDNIRLVGTTCNKSVVFIDLVTQ